MIPSHQQIIEGSLSTLLKALVVPWGKKARLERGGFSLHKVTRRGASCEVKQSTLSLLSLVATLLLVVESYSSPLSLSLSLSLLVSTRLY